MDIKMDLDRWIGKLAVVTGASSGIGYAICEKFVNAGINVVGMARRVNLIQQLSEKASTGDVKLYPLHCDVSEEGDILKAFVWIEQNLGGIAILINNAGVLMPTRIIDGDSEMWKKTMYTNVMGLSICTREAIKSMRKYEIDGQIIHVSSIAGHFIPRTEVPCLNVYCPSKHAIRAATETLRRELNYNKLKIKITSISPGLVATNLIGAGSGGIEKAAEDAPNLLRSSDIADACIYILSTSPNVQIHDLMIRPVGEEL